MNPQWSDAPSGDPSSFHSGSGILVLAMIALVLFSHFVVWSFSESDPVVETGVASALPEDGLWPLAGARGAVLGIDPGVPEHFNRPLIDWVQGAIYQVFGITRETSRMLPWLGLVALLLLVPTLISRRHGRKVAILGAILIASEPTWISWCRAPVILPLASFFVFALPALATIRGWIPPLVSLAVALVVTYSLSPLVVIAVPAVLVEVLRRVNPDSKLMKLHPVTLVAGSVIALLLIRVAPGSDIGALAAVLTGSTTGPDPSLLPSIATLLPALILCWWFSFLLGLRGGTDPLQGALHLTVCFGLLPWLVTSHMPISPLMVLFPLLVFLSVDGWVLLISGKSTRVNSEGSLCLLCWLGTGLLTVRLATDITSANALGLAPLVGLSILGLLILLGLATRFRRVSFPAATYLASLLLLLGCVPGTLLQLGDSMESWDRARTTLPRLLPPDSTLGGRWSHALALDQGIPCITDHDRPMVSHALVDGGEQPPSGSILLDQINIFGERLYLIRIAGESTAALDRASQLEARGDSRGAKEAIFMVLRSDAQLGLAWERLGRILLQEGDVEGAVECFGYALQTDPDRAEARLELARLYLANGFDREGTAHLQHWLRLTGGASERPVVQGKR